MADLETYVDEYIDLTGRKVRDTIFDGCVVRLDSGGCNVQFCEFINCERVGDGWPATLLTITIHRPDVPEN